MGILTIILIIAVFLAIIGLGLDTFIDGIMRGIDRLGLSNVASNITENADDVIQNLTREWVNPIISRQLISTFAVILSCFQRKIKRPML